MEYVARADVDNDECYVIATRSTLGLFGYFRLIGAINLYAASRSFDRHALSIGGVNL